jgi:hypothetical protein
LIRFFLEEWALMKGNRSLFIAVGVVAVLILGWWIFRRGGGSGAVELIDRFASAEKRPNPGIFAVEDVTINGETKKGIAVTPTVGSRLIFKARIPDDGWLRVSVALKQEAWTQEGDGVRFMALVSDGRASDELFVQDINPFVNQTDRKWIPVMVDLSAYAGEEVDVIFNTFASGPGKGMDMRNDLAVWGAPEIVVR